MSDPTLSPSAPAFRRDRSPLARQTARAKKADREQRIVGLLNRGVSVAEIAEREGVSLLHMRNMVRTILARRQPQAPAEYLALQVNRLNEAMLISYNAMCNNETGANFSAVDRVMKLVREMDRYHGFAPEGRRSDPGRLPAPAMAEPPLALAAPSSKRIENGAASD